MSDSPTQSTRPLSVWSISLILLLQGGAVLLTTISQALASQAQVLDAAGQIALVVLYLLGAIVLILLGFRMWVGSSAARTPTLVIQLLIVVLSFSFFAGGDPLAGALFLVPAAAALVLLFVGSTQRWLSQE